MKKMYLFFILLISLFIQDNVNANSVSLYGFTPASVDSIPSFPLYNKPIQKQENRFVSIIAEIDKKGRLKKINLQNEKDSLILNLVKPFLEKLTFQPAELYNKKIESFLPIRFIISKSVYSPIFSFPLIQDSIVLDNELFESAFELNNIETPKLLTFPKYFSNLNIMDTSNRYPYIVEKLTFTNNILENITNELSTYDPFVAQIESAILYSSFNLPKVKSKKFNTQAVFLMVSFFPQISYPVANYDGLNPDTTSLLHQYRLKLVNRFSRYLSEPIPKRVSSYEYPRVNFSSFLPEPIDVFVRIDTIGNAFVLRAGTSQKKILNSVRLLVSKLKFYPAITQNKELVKFNGFIRIESFDKLNIRISYLWLK